MKFEVQTCNYSRVQDFVQHGQSSARICTFTYLFFSVLFQIFFHYSEFQGDITDVLLGDDVQFVIQDRNVC